MKYQKSIKECHIRTLLVLAKDIAFLNHGSYDFTCYKTFCIIYECRN